MVAWSATAIPYATNAVMTRSMTVLRVCAIPHITPQQVGPFGLVSFPTLGRACSHRQNGWRDSNSGPPDQRLPGSGRAGGLTCGSLAPVVTASARCTRLHAGSPCTQRVPGRLGPRPVADALGCRNCPLGPVRSAVVSCCPSLSPGARLHPLARPHDRDRSWRSRSRHRPGRGDLGAVQGDPQRNHVRCAQPPRIPSTGG
jgi:hypothetical protein